MDKDSTSREIEVEDIAFYYEEMVRSNLVELEVETPQGKIVLKRLHPEKEQSQKAGHPLRRQTDFITKAETVPMPSQTKTIATPITGIFYRSSSPQSVPFVKEGEIVNAGSNLCIIEAMKVMNEIKSDVRCKIIKILVENGKSVTKGQSLFQVEPQP